MVHHARYEEEVHVKTIVVGPYENNCYILMDPKTGESAIIDAPAEPEKVLAAARDTKVRYIFITHNHGDHTGALVAVAEATGAKVAAHRDDAAKLPRKPDFQLSHEDRLYVGKVPVQVLHTPGHTPGSVCLVTGGHVFTGDTLFPGGPGRSANPEALRQEIDSIRSRLLVLDPATHVYPGHGVGTTIRAAREEYASFASRKHLADLHGDVLWLSS